MPWGRYPERVKAFKKWATERVDSSKLSDSATPHGFHVKRRKFRMSRRKKSRGRKKVD